jgi:uncharacterized integral membrane protein
MRYFYITVSILLFLATLGFALKNDTTVTLTYYLGLEWHAPLILVMLLAFCSGAFVGIIACLPRIIRERRRLLAMQRELRDLQSEQDGHV